MISQRVRGIKFSETLQSAAKAKELQKQGIDVVSFAVGEPDFDTPAHIKKAAIEAISQGFTKYTPAEGIPELRQAIAQHIHETLGLEYDAKQVVVTNGSKQALYNFFQAALNPGDEVILPAPYWLSYPPMIQLAGAIPKIINTTASGDFKLTPGQLKKAIKSKTKALVLNSPSNPTGSTYTKEELWALADILENTKIWVVSDDAYSKILYDGMEFHSLAQYSKKLFSKTIIFNTFSKSYAMTGWRVGYAIGPQDIIKPIGIIQSQSTSGANSIAQKAALKALTSSQDSVKAMVREFEQRRNVALEALNKIKGGRCFKPQGAFYLFPDFSKYYGKKYKGKPIQGSQDLVDYFFEEAKVVMLPGHPFGADTYVRISYAACVDQIQKGLSRIKTALEQL